MEVVLGATAKGTWKSKRSLWLRKNEPFRLKSSSQPIAPFLLRRPTWMSVVVESTGRTVSYWPPERPCTAGAPRPPGPGDVKK